jgi:dihydroorotase
MTIGGARFGLSVPRIAPGELANLALVDLEAQYEVGADGYVSRSANCCFHGRTLHGKILLTIAAGNIAYRARMLAEAGTLTPR